MDCDTSAPGWQTGRRNVVHPYFSFRFACLDLITGGKDYEQKDTMDVSASGI